MLSTSILIMMMDNARRAGSQRMGSNSRLKYMKATKELVHNVLHQKAYSMNELAEKLDIRLADVAALIDSLRKDGVIQEIRDPAVVGTYNRKFLAID